MSESAKNYPYANTEIVRLIRNRIDELSGTRTQREIAAAIGYDKPNAFSMFKRGETKVPLERLPAIAKTLNLDLALLFRAGLSQWWPTEQKELAEMFSQRIVTPNERALLKLVREYLNADDADVSLDLLERLRRALKD